MTGTEIARWGLRGLCTAACLAALAQLAVAGRAVLDGWTATAALGASPLPRTSEPRRRSDRAALAVIARRSLFLAPEPAPPPEVPRAEPSALRLELLGTVYLGDPARSHAVVRSARTRDTHVVRAGNEIENLHVIEVRDRALIVRRAGRLERLEMPDAERAMLALTRGSPSRREVGDTAPQYAMSFAAASLDRAESPAPPRSDAPPGDLDPAPPAAPDAGAGLRPEQQRALRRLSQDVRLIPQFSASGGIQGILLRDLRPASALWRAGLREGDVVIAVAGERVRDPAALSRLRSTSLAGPVLVEVRRGGETRRIQLPAGVLELPKEAS